MFLAENYVDEAVYLHCIIAGGAYSVMVPFVEMLVLVPWLR